MASRMLSCLTIIIFQNENIYIPIRLIRIILLEQSTSSRLKREDKCKRAICLMCVLLCSLINKNQHQSQGRIHSQGRLLSSTISQTYLLSPKDDPVVFLPCLILQTQILLSLYSFS